MTLAPSSGSGIRIAATTPSAAWSPTRLRGRVPDGVDGRSRRTARRRASSSGSAARRARSSSMPPCPARAVGTIRRFDAARDPLPEATFGLSTHGFGLVEAIELARVLGSLPERCVIYAIEARSFDLGAALSPAVAAAVDDVVERVLAEIAGGGLSHARARPDRSTSSARWTRSRGPQGARKVTRVEVWLGALSHMSPGHFARALRLRRDRLHRRGRGPRLHRLRGPRRPRTRPPSC